MPSGISVVICCYNSAERIAATLRHLLIQKDIPFSSWEVIVVDNGSADNTAEIANQIWASFDVEKPVFKVVKEPAPGLSNARKKGIDESFFDYILFCDDDNWLDEVYLCNSLNIMQSSPGIGALGGIGHPVFEDREPPYFWVNQYHALAVGKQSDMEGDITDGRGVLYGAGMILNKAAFKILADKFRFQFQLSDRVGTNLASSGDHELCFALKKIGYRIYYSPNLNFKHFIPEYRTTLKYYKKLFYNFGISYVLLQVYRVNKRDLYNFKNDYKYNCCRCIMNIVFVSTKLILKGYYFKREKYKYVNELHSLYSNIGMFKAFMKVKNSFRTKYTNFPIFNENAGCTNTYTYCNA